ncbi:MAG TPA: DUF4149 domain-containing protein [Gemmatimonadaceae bacterium]|nr:DUF4149 domain-containing protein [Gemmatimonadaceae bacterium]
MSSRADALLWLWIGAALLFAAVVAPALFAVLPARALAGLVVGRVLPVLFWSGVGVGAIAAVTHDGWRRAAALVLVMTALGAQLGVAPRIQRLRAALGPDIEALAKDDPQRVAFGTLHGVSVALLGAALLAAAAIAVAGLRAPGATPALGADAVAEGPDRPSRAAGR